MKYSLLILVVIMILTLVSCDSEKTPNESESLLSVVSDIGNISSENTSEESLERWTETQIENNITITTEYSNYGDNWIRTTKTYAEEGYLKEESVYAIVNKETVKKFDCKYDENGKVLYSSTEEIKDSGKTIEKTLEDRVFLVEEEDGVCLYTTEMYELDEQGKEQFVESESTYRLDSDDSIVLYNKKYNEVIDKENFIVNEYTFYKDGHVHYYLYRATTHSADERYDIIYDIEMNPIYEYHHTDHMETVSELYYRQNGYLQGIIQDNVITYYESSDGIESTWFFQVEKDSATGEVKKAICNGDHYDIDTANSLYAEFNSLYSNVIALSRDVDYAP